MDSFQIQEVFVRYFNDIAVKLAAFLEKNCHHCLRTVGIKLSSALCLFSKIKSLEQRQIISLDGLDLAGLLRVLNQNWYQISNTMIFSSEARHFVKDNVNSP